MMKRIGIFAIITGLFSSILACSAEAKILIVPSKTHKTIQSAIEAANTGDIVRISAGKYKESFILKSGITLEGTKAGQTIIIPKKYAHTAILAIDSKNCIIRNLTIDGQNIAYRKCYGLGFSIRKTGDNIYISNIYDKKLKSHYKLQTGMQIISIDNKSAEHIFLTCLSEKAVNLKLLNETQTIQCNLTSKVHPIYGKFTYRPNGIMLINSHVTIENCNIKNLGGDGIVIMGDKSYVKISNNKIENNVYGVWFCWASKGIASDNICIHNKGAGIAITDEGTFPIIKNNKCTSNKLNGIYIGNFANGVIENNDCRANKLHSVYIYQAGEKIKLSQNHLK